MDERLGEHCGVVQNERSKTIDSLARASCAGVSKNGSTKPIACQCCWSEHSTSRFGRRLVDETRLEEPPSPGSPATVGFANSNPSTRLCRSLRKNLPTSVLVIIAHSSMGEWSSQYDEQDG